MAITILTLGNKTFPTNIIQGPLAGISTAPFRELSTRYGNPAYNCTEMISCKTLLHQPDFAQQRFIKKDPKEGPLSFQLSSTEPVELGRAVKKVTDLGADLIDLNCGCPVKKIRTRGAGSRLLSDAGKLFQLITAMKQNTHLPVSIKIRVDGASEEKFNLEVAKVITEAGADFVVVHGRHWTEHYETPCNYEQIAFFVAELKVPVIGNGDVKCVSSLKKMLATGCAGVMIGRAGVGQPWLTQQLMAEMTGTIYKKPTLSERSKMFLEHTAGLIELLASEKFAIYNARKLAKYYARDLPDRDAFTDAINQSNSFRAFEDICLDHFITD
jgi:tRNA-dihydrouridine synthase B